MAGLRRCPKCAHYETPEGFYKSDTYCKICRKSLSKDYRKRHPERAREQAALYRQYAGTKVNGYRLKYRYGISLDDHKALVAAQGGKCAICRSGFERTPHVDHCHTTGRIRGMLCDRCNRGIGYFADSPERLIAAADYLKVKA